MDSDTIEMIPLVEKRRLLAHVAWVVFPALLRGALLASLVPGCSGVMLVLWIPLLALGALWLVAGVAMLFWSTQEPTRGRLRGSVTVAAAVAAACGWWLVGSLSETLSAVAIRREFAQYLEGPAPPLGFCVDDGQFWFDDTGYLIGETSDSDDEDQIVLDLAGVWWSDQGRHRLPRGESAVIPMDTCDICVAYPLGDGWWFLWLNN